MNLADHWDNQLTSHRPVIESRLWSRLSKLTPLRRDLVSDGYDEAVDLLRREVPFAIREYPTGMKCDTWTVPRKWTCHRAALKTLAGEVVLSDQDTPLRVPSYSQPFCGVVSREELAAHLHTHPGLPEAIPFKYFYYEPRWGLCCSEVERESLTERSYRVEIEAGFSDGHLKVLEASTGSGPGTLLLCAHLCHPSMANDDASGVSVAVETFRFLSELPDLGVRVVLLLMPESVGSAAWLTDPERVSEAIDAGLFFEMLGRDLPFSVQRTLNDNHELDVALETAARSVHKESWSAGFAGVICNDERQFNGPGFEIPMASLSRVLPMGMPGRPYPEYHSHLDTLERCSVTALFDSVRVAVRTVASLQSSPVPVPRFRGELFLQGLECGRELLRDVPLRLKFLRFTTRLNGRDSLRKVAAAARVSPEEAEYFLSLLAQDGMAHISDRCVLGTQGRA